MIRNENGSITMDKQEFNLWCLLYKCLGHREGIDVTRAKLERLRKEKAERARWTDNTVITKTVEFARKERDDEFRTAMSVSRIADQYSSPDTVEFVKNLIALGEGLDEEA